MADCYMVLVIILLIADIAVGSVPLDALNLPVYIRMSMTDVTSKNIYTPNHMHRVLAIANLSLYEKICF